MARLKTFPVGGIHPRNIGLDTLERPIRNAQLPHFVYIPLAQHIGVPAEPVVNVGDRVEAGDVIGKASGFVSVNIHASLPGKVVAIEKATAPLGENVPTVIIEFEGYFNVTRKKADKHDWKQGKDIRKILQEKGVVGLGGATFPTHVKYSVPEGKKIDTLIINAVECEPFLSADYRLMMERGEELMEGIEIARHLLGVSNVYIGIEADTPRAIEEMKKAAADYKSGFRVVPLKVKYPQGAEKQLIKAILNREVPSGGLPLDVGVVVSNIGTIYAMKEAVVDELPLTERVVTVTGTIVKNPGNYKIKIGTRISDVLEEFGLKEEPGKVIMGGPMMGQAQYTPDTPVIKGTSGILVLSKKQAKQYPHNPCIRCGKCITVCPMGLDPTRLVTMVELHQDAAAMEDGVMDCMECGSCSYVCPSGRHLAQVIKLEKLRNAARKKEATSG